MAVQFRMPGPSNVLPEASGQIIEYIRKPNKFKINKYAQFIETDTTNGAYALIDPDQPIRVVADAEFAWAEGDARPTGNANQMTYEMLPFRTERRSYPWTIGEITQEIHKRQNKIDWTQQYTGMVASQAMTNRTNRVISKLQDTANWGDNTASANTLNGGFGNWRYASSDPASASYLAIKKTLDTCCTIINLKTNGVVNRSDLKLIVSPNLARIMGETSEIWDYIKYGRYSEPAQQGKDRDLDEDFGLPKMLYGIEPVVEDAGIITVPPNSSGTLASITTGQRSYIKNDTTAILVSRVGGIEGSYGAPSFSTMQIYFYGPPMEVEAFPDKENRRLKGYCTENYFEVVAATAAGFLITGVS